MPARVGITLDESEFCEQCRPGVAAPKLALVVQAQPSPRRVEGIDETDVLLLAEFLQGKQKHQGDMGAEEPLKKHTRRLAELLGLGPGTDEPSDA